MKKFIRNVLKLSRIAKIANFNKARIAFMKWRRVKRLIPKRNIDIKPIMKSELEVVYTKESPVEPEVPDRREYEMKIESSKSAEKSVERGAIVKNRGSHKVKQKIFRDPPQKPKITVIESKPTIVPKKESEHKLAPKHHS